MKGVYGGGVQARDPHLRVWGNLGGMYEDGDGGCVGMRMTDELFDTLTETLAKATDAAVLFVPHDSAVSEQSGEGWTLGHVIVHLTATLENAAASAAMLARGVVAKERLRYETLWQKLSTLQMVQARMKESQRMCYAFLHAWPDDPHLDMTVALIPLLGPMDAIGLYALGIAHGQGHLDQLREMIRQYTPFLGL